MRFVTIVLALLVPASAVARGDFFSEFFIGEYVLVGKGLNTNKTYTGKVEIYRENGALKLKRKINNQVIAGNVALEPASGGDTRVIRFRYEEAGVSYEQTCLWQSDLDNYARISCYLYQPEVPTADPGLEVLFNDHAAKRAYNE